MTARPQIVSVVTAAGLGRRLGQDKALVGLGGASAIERVVTAHRAAGVDEVVVVRRRGAAALPDGLPARIVEGDPPEMIDSVRLGLSAVDAAAGWILVHPVDYSLACEDGVVTALRRACDRAEPTTRVVAPSLGGRLGHPLALDLRLRAAILDPETESLRDVVRAQRAHTAYVEVDNPWVRRDLDEPGDLAAARAWLDRPQGPVTAVMRAHRSRRDYHPDPVPVEQLRWIVDCARHASTSSLMQAYSVVAVCDAERRDAVARLCADQPHIRSAPVFLAVCADLHKIQQACDAAGAAFQGDSVEIFLQATIDAAILGQNIQLGAESEGLGTCMIGAARNHPVEIAELLALPPHVYVAFGMTVGIPADDPIPRGRMPLGGVLHAERYDTDAAAKAVEGADAAMRAWAARTNAERGGYGGKPVNETRGWTDRMVWLWGRPAPAKGRAGLVAALRARGFGLRADEPPGSEL